MRSWSAGIQTLLNSLSHESFAVLVSFDALGLRLTNWGKAITYGGETYSPTVFEVNGLSENLYAEAPAASLVTKSLDASAQVLFFEDSFRGDTVTIRILMMSGGAWTDTTYSLTLTCDADQATADEVPIRLASSDAVEGTDVPRRTSQEVGCQHDFMTGGCPYRGLLASCDKGLTSPNGCKAHFPDLCMETGRAWTAADATAGRTLIRQPLPYGAAFGGLTHRLVLG